MSNIADKLYMIRNLSKCKQGKVVGYVRCSSIQQVQDGDTLLRQIELIGKYCADHGLGDPEIVPDEGISGFKAARPGFQRLLHLCRAGEVSHVVVTDLSRLSRSVRDTLSFVDEIVQRHGVRLISLTQDLDTGTPFGRAFLTFIAVFAQLYRDEIAFKTKVALRHKRSKGERYSGSVPYGYDDDGNGKLVASEHDQAAMTRAQALRAEGASLRAIARQLDQEGFKTKRGGSWSAQVIKDLLARSVSYRDQKIGHQLQDES